ncbi:hypothetical protein BJ170DRAFT_199257 [Xylariales sp. AK1849]|nr:hypothetical protein BJ170DRAFT_199257 [Xylariales sp. AK1849]
MQYTTFQYPGPMPSSWYTAGQAMETVDHGHIDPDLNNPNAIRGPDPWNPHQPVRSLTGHGEHPYLAHSYIEDIFGVNGIRRSDGTAPLPSALLPRQGSPPEQPSSTCSSALSPLGESDYGLDNAPLTPQDDVNLPPFSSQYDAWGSQGQLFHLTGLTSDYVKPGDVSFYQEPIPNYSEEKNPEFPRRGFSMSSHGSSYDVNHASQLEQGRLASRDMSPAEVSHDIKEEICIPDFNQSGTYPPLESEDDQSICEEVIEIPRSDDVDDEDYKPRGAHKRTNSNASRNPRSRKRSSASQPASQGKKPKLEPTTPIGQRPTNKSNQGVKQSFACNECRDIAFKDESGLQKHIKQQHTRPFVCIFNFAGCDSTFASKNEWKRHVASQHLLLNYWLCHQDACAKLSNTSTSPSRATGTSRKRSSSSAQSQINCVPVLPNGAIFNRKDLYTQHLRRMHIPPTVKKQVKQRKTVPEWEERIKIHQEEAHKLRCGLPCHMECPALGCNAQFDGPGAWDERMEHVAKHLEKAANGSESAVHFGGESDVTLMEWAIRPDVAVVKGDGKGKWVLNNPLKPERNAKSQPTTYSEEDAEGEDE